MFIALGLTLAVSDYTAIFTGETTDPVTDIFMRAFGDTGFRFVMVIVLVSYVSCTISLQAAASRLMYSMGRDAQLPGHRLLGKFSATRAVPPYALLAAGALPAVVVIISLLSADALVAIVSFASLGIYLATARSCSPRCGPGCAVGFRPSTPSDAGVKAVSIVALVYQVFAMITLLRPAGGVWYQSWLVALVGAAVVGTGLLATCSPPARIVAVAASPAMPPAGSSSTTPTPTRSHRPRRSSTWRSGWTAATRTPTRTPTDARTDRAPAEHHVKGARVPRSAWCRGCEAAEGMGFEPMMTLPP